MKPVFIKTITIVTVAALIAMPVFLSAPQQTYAARPVFEVGKQLKETTLQRIKDNLNLISTHTNTAANTAEKINTYVLMPLAFVMSGDLLRVLTASVISFVVGATSGTGAPQFVQDVQGHMRFVGDNRASAFFVQFGRNSNSPFASAISSSLRTNYLQNTSSAGFFAANRNTLYRASPNINTFLDGDWSQGGARAWFALTTQSQNNPYLFYHASQNQLAIMVDDAVTARLTELNWGQGFLSWCGPAIEGAEGTGIEGTAPGDSCTTANGNPGIIKTPGSTIKATLDRALGSVKGKLENVGQLAKEVGGILGNVSTVFQTVNLASNILGGPGSGGLGGFGQVSGTQRVSPLRQYQANEGFMGAGQSDVFRNAATLDVIRTEPETRIRQYEQSWNAIRSSAVAAQTSLNDLATFCASAASKMREQLPEIGTDRFATAREIEMGRFITASNNQANAARSALVSVVSPVIVQADAAAAIVVAARAEVTRLQGQLNAGAEGAAGRAQVDGALTGITNLLSMRPTANDVGSALQESQATGFAVASPEGSLNVSGGSLIDQMNLVASNAGMLKMSVCVFTPQNPDGISQ